MTELELPAGARDLVFSNWLLMYLSDEECSKLAANLLRWVRQQQQQQEVGTARAGWVCMRCLLVTST